jgi:hypothetical protein
MVPDGWYLTSDAAALVGRSADTLRKYKRDDIFAPSGFMWAGTLKVALYSEKDIEELRKVAARQRPGPKSKESA